MIVMNQITNEDNEYHTQREVKHNVSTMTPNEWCTCRNSESQGIPFSDEQYFLPDVITETNEQMYASSTHETLAITMSSENKRQCSGGFGGSGSSTNHSGNECFTVTYTCYKSTEISFSNKRTLFHRPLAVVPLSSRTDDASCSPAAVSCSPDDVSSSPDDASSSSAALSCSPDDVSSSPAAVSCSPDDVSSSPAAGNCSHNDASTPAAVRCSFGCLPVADNPCQLKSHFPPIPQYVVPTASFTINYSRCIVDAIKCYSEGEPEILSLDEEFLSGEKIKAINPSQGNINPYEELTLPNLVKPIDYFQQHLNVAEYDYCYKQTPEVTSKPVTRRGEQQYLNREPCPSCFQGKDNFCVYEFVRQAKIAGLPLQENYKHLQSMFFNFITALNKKSLKYIVQ